MKQTLPCDRGPATCTHLHSVFSEVRGPPRVYTTNDFGVAVDVPDDRTGPPWIHPMSGSMDDPFRRAGTVVWDTHRRSSLGGRL